MGLHRADEGGRVSAGVLGSRVHPHPQQRLHYRHVRPCRAEKANVSLLLLVIQQAVRLQCEPSSELPTSEEVVHSVRGVVQLWAIHLCPWEGRCKDTWKGESKLPWREAGPPNHLDDKVDSDQ